MIVGAGPRRGKGVSLCWRPEPGRGLSRRGAGEEGESSIIGAKWGESRGETRAGGEPIRPGIGESGQSGLGRGGGRAGIDKHMGEDGGGGPGGEGGGGRASLGRV